MIRKLKHLQQKCDAFFSEDYVPKATPWWQYALVFGPPAVYFIGHVIVAVVKGWI